MRPLRWILMLAAVLAMCSLHTNDAMAAPTAQQRAKARELADTGLKAFKTKNYQGAIDAFEAAEKLIHAPPHWLYIARSYRNLGKLLHARDVYRDLVGEKLSPRAPRAFKKAISTAGRELGELEKSIPVVAVEITGPDIAATRVHLNGKPMDDVTAEVDPGSYTVDVEADGYGPETRTVDVEAGSGTNTVSIDMASNLPVDPEEQGEELPVGPIVLAATGVVVLALGGVFGGLALWKADRVKEVCPTNPCPTSNEKVADKANAYATASTTMLVVGGVAAAAGGSWLIYHYVADDADEAGDDEVALRPLLGPGFVGLEGAF